MIKQSSYCKYSILYNDGKNNYQNDLRVFNMKRNHKEAIRKFEKEFGKHTWAVLVDQDTGKVVKSLKPEV